jgi:hypothetical protein
MSIDRMGGKHIISKEVLQKLIMANFVRQGNDFRIGFNELLRTPEVTSCRFFLRFIAITVNQRGGHVHMGIMRTLRRILLFFVVIFLFACAGKTEVYRDPNMDFGAIRSIAVMPFLSLARDNIAAERVRDVFINDLLATGAVYVVPVGEVARGVTRAEIANPATPSPEEVIKLAGIIKVQAVITGALKEYGEVRSGTTSANIISVSLQMMESQTGKIVWSASTTKGGISIWDRLFGGGGQPMDKITQKAVEDLINKLFK